MVTNLPNDYEVLIDIYESLRKLSKIDQQRLLKTVVRLLDLSMQDLNIPPVSPGNLFPKSIAENPASSTSTFSRDRAISLKDFMHVKDPRTDVDRVACLAYYLTHYRDKVHFRTLDISALNTEAAQPKFASTSVAVENATRLGLLVQAGKGSKQVSSAGERYVEQLPDRESARASIKKKRHKRKQRKISNSKLKNLK